MTIAILGAGPHGEEIGRHFEATTLDVRVEFYDDNPGRYPTLTLSPCEIGGNMFPWVVGAAWPSVRRQIATAHPYQKAPHDFGRVFQIGSFVSGSAQTGWHLHVGPNAVISHGCTIGHYVTVCAGAMLGGEVEVADEVVIGIGASVIHGGIQIGHGAFVGAGAVVVDNVPPGAVVAGNPARVVATDWDPRDMVAGRRGRLYAEAPPAVPVGFMPNLPTPAPAPAEPAGDPTP